MTEINVTVSEQIAAQQYAEQAEAAKQAALTAKAAAELAETNAETAETNAETAQGLAETAKTGAEAARDAAITAKETATTQAGIATTKAGEALTSANNANTAKLAAEAAKDTALANNEILGGIAYNAAAPTPVKSGKYSFTTGGICTWLTGGAETVAVGDEVVVVFTAPSTYTYTKVGRPDIEQVRSQSTSKVPSSKLVDDELNKKAIYNVTNEVPLTAGQYYTQSTAIAAVPTASRKTGLVITYATASGIWVTEQFKGTDTSVWTTLSNWVTKPNEIEQSRSQSTSKVPSSKLVDDELSEIESSINVFYPDILSPNVGSTIGGAYFPLRKISLINLYNPFDADFKDGMSIASNTGSLDVGNGLYSTTGFLNVQSLIGQKIIMSISGVQSLIRFALFYDENKNAITTSYYNNTTLTSLPTVPSGAYYMRVSFAHNNKSRFEIELQIQAGIFITEYEYYWQTKKEHNEPTRILDGAVTETKTSFFAASKNLLKKSEAVDGYYVGSDGSINSTASYSTSGYIDVRNKIGQKICASVDGVQILIRFACFFDINYTAIPANYFNNTTLLTLPTIPSNAVYARFSFTKSGLVAVTNYQLEYSNIPTYYVSYEEKQISEYIKKDISLYSNKYLGLDTLTTANYGSMPLKKSGALTDGLSISLEDNMIRKNSDIQCLFTISTFTSIQFGRGYNVYSGSWVEVDATNVKLYSYDTSAVLIATYAHGLTITSQLWILIQSTDVIGTAKLKLISDSGMFEQDISWFAGRATFIRSIGSTINVISINHVSKDYKKPIYIFGDSYLSIANVRWIYYPITWGYDTFLIDARPGASSSEEYPRFLLSLAHGTPKYAIWALGMNDAADIATYDSTWKTNIDAFISACNSKKITPILCTIPSVPTKNHDYKNAWVRGSGHRYIDFDLAVSDGTESNTWKIGMLDSDGIHPTILGAMALAMRAINDFPEIMN